MEMIYLDPPEALGVSLGEAMFTQRAIRRFRHDRPIGEEELKVVLDAASKAPSGGNSQPARYLVIREPDLRRRFGQLYREAWWAKRFDDHGWISRADIPAGSIYEMPALLAEEMVEVPAVVLAFSLTPGGASSVLPGVQNLLLAARGLGIGSVLTTLHPKVMERVYALFGVPAEIEFHCCVPLGYPRGGFGPTRRLPSRHTTSWDRWGEPPPW